MIVRFLRNYDYRVRTNVLIAYKAGHTGRVTRTCAAKAIAAGAAEPVRVRRIRRPA